MFGLLFFCFIIVIIITIPAAIVQQKIINSTSPKGKLGADESSYKAIPDSDEIHIIEEPKYETTTFHIAGTTFKDGRQYRQAALRMLKFKDEPMDGNILFEFEQYEYEDKPAVKIMANGRVLGTVPADIVDEFIDKMENAEDYDIDYMVIGGNGVSYGCVMTFTWK